jgi:hypothetical protein
MAGLFAYIAKIAFRCHVTKSTTFAGDPKCFAEFFSEDKI